MHRGRRLISLAGMIAAIATTLSVGTVAAAGPRTVGHVYVNNNSSGHNTIAALRPPRRWLPDADRWLAVRRPAAPERAHRTGRPVACSAARTAAICSPTDPASNQISVLRIKPNGALQLVEVEASNGTSPVSIAVHDGLVYVANSGAGGSNYTGFRLNAGGHLSRSPDRPIALPDDAMPGHVLFSPRWPPARRHAGGSERRPVIPRQLQHRRRRPAHAGPGFAVRRSADRSVRQRILADPRRPALRLERPRRPGAGCVSAYDVGADGTLTAIAGSPFADNQTAPCWVAISPDGQRPVRGEHRGAVDLALRGRAGRHADAGRLARRSRARAGLRPFDAQLSPDGRYLYVVDAGAAKISAFAVERDDLTELDGSPVLDPGRRRAVRHRRRVTSRHGRPAR